MSNRHPSVPQQSIKGVPTTHLGRVTATFRAEEQHPETDATARYQHAHKARTHKARTHKARTHKAQTHKHVLAGSTTRVHTLDRTHPTQTPCHHAAFPLLAPCSPTWA
jgi:hypothetical protein